MPPSDGAAGDLASTPSMPLSSIMDFTSRNRKRKNQAGQDARGRKRFTGDPLEAQQNEAHQKATNAIDAAQEAMWAHGPQSQECQDALRLADELVNISNAFHRPMRKGPRAGGSASAMCPAAGRSDSTVGCAAESSGSMMGPGLASEEFEEIEVEELE